MEMNATTDAVSSGLTDAEFADKYAYLSTPLVQAFDWVGLVALAGTTFVIGAKLFNFKPPDKNCLYYFGYNERGMASLYVNMFAATAYWAKVCSHLSGNPNSGNNIVLYQYFDYMFTCPLLTLDLLWTLNLPYKITYSFMVFLTLFSGFAAAGHPQPGRWMWFIYGMVIFSFTWLRIIGLVQVRFLQYFTKKEKPANPSTDSQKRMSMASKSGLRDKSVRNPLQTALGTYFLIWMIYPILWLLSEGELISPTINHCCSVIMDVLAKSMYGFALLKFQLLVDKNQVHFTELKVTKAELVEEYKDGKKKIRQLQRQQEEDDGDSDSDEDWEDEPFDDQMNQHAGSDVGSNHSNLHQQQGMQGLDPNTVSQEQIKMLMSQLNTGAGGISPGGPPRMYDENAQMGGSRPAYGNTSLASLNNRPPSPRLAPSDGDGPGVGDWRNRQ